MLWDLGRKQNILKAISLITKNSYYDQYIQMKTLNWFNLPALNH